MPLLCVWADFQCWVGLHEMTAQLWSSCALYSLDTVSVSVVFDRQCTGTRCNLHPQFHGEIAHTPTLQRKPHLPESLTTMSVSIRSSNSLPFRTYRDQLSQVFTKLVDVSQLDSGDAGNLKSLKRPELGVTFTKLYAWTLTEYSKYVLCGEHFRLPVVVW